MPAGDAGTEELTTAVRAACTETLARQRHPGQFQLIDRLPRSPTGKLRRRQLRDGFGTNGFTRLAK
jgi:acyl-coenzyme A synthetase/AMP-(fatty) acid ligase